MARKTALYYSYTHKVEVEMACSKRLCIALRCLQRMHNELRSADFPFLHFLETTWNSIESVWQDFDIVRLKQILISFLLAPLDFAYLDNTILQPLSKNAPNCTTHGLVSLRMGVAISGDDGTTLSFFLLDDRA